MQTILIKVNLRLSQIFLPNIILTNRSKMDTKHRITYKYSSNNKILFRLTKVLQFYKIDKIILIQTTKQLNHSTIHPPKIGK